MADEKQKQVSFELKNLSDAELTEAIKHAEEHPVYRLMLIQLVNMSVKLDAIGIRLGLVRQEPRIVKPNIIPFNGKQN